MRRSAVYTVEASIRHWIEIRRLSLWPGSIWPVQNGCLSVVRESARGVSVLLLAYPDPGEGRKTPSTPS